MSAAGGAETRRWSRPGRAVTECAPPAEVPAQYLFFSAGAAWATERVLGGAGARISSSAGAAAQGGLRGRRRGGACGRGSSGSGAALGAAAPTDAALHLQIVGKHGCVSAPWGAQRGPGTACVGQRAAAPAPTNLTALLNAGAAPSIGMAIDQRFRGSFPGGGPAARYIHQQKCLAPAVLC